MLKAPWSSPCSSALSAYYTCSDSNICTISPTKENAFSNLTSCFESCEHRNQTITADMYPKFLSSVLSFSSGAWVSMSLFSFAFTCQVTFPPLASQLQNPTPGRVLTMIIGAISFTGVIYTMFAIGGYISFCDRTDGDIFNCYSFQDNEIIAGRIALSGFPRASFFEIPHIRI